ncbi:GntR family transcriptional regulator, partial [Streptomyces rubiginosohelvolus]
MPPQDTSAPGAPREGRGRDVPPARQALSDSVYENIKAMVMDHEITPGARVSIEALSRALSVSPTPIREALATLEADGLVVKRPLS